MTTAPEPESYLSRSIELLWGTGARPARGPKPALTLNRIVETAISLADTDGLDAVSMRRIARELGVGTMSLYRYVPGKAELLDLMLDRVSDPSGLQTQAAGLSWRGIMEAAARDSYHVYVSHPWTLGVNWARPVLGPNTLAGVELVVAGLAGLGLTDQERIMVLSVIDGYVVGVARSYVQYTSAAEETGISDEEFWAQQAPALERAMSTGRFPALAALADDSFNAGWEETFEFGLHRLLDGLETFIDGRRQQP